MNIIIFTSANNLSGGSRQALYQARGLHDRGHRVHFFVPSQSALIGLDPEAPFWRFFSGKTPRRAELEALFEVGAANVVHAFHNAAVKALAWWGLFWKKQAATAAHRGVIFRPNNPLPYWSPGIDLFLVNSRACGRIIANMGASTQRIRYLPNAVPDARLTPAIEAHDLRASFDIGARDLVFLCIGGDAPYKGTKVLLQAWALAFGQNSTHTRLVLVGHNPNLWRPLAAELKIDEQLIFAGQREDVGSFLAAADAFVLPSLSESMPNTLLEALRTALPCVGTRVGAVPDILAPQGKAPCGLLAPPGDANALCAALRQLADNADLRRALAQASALQGRAFHPDKRLDKLEAAYADILRKKGLPL
ncbi:glycosyltransferase family 4 protein [Desulfovibrio sp. OttesenSCG-928-F20]|nr:glycosyltransferase family 4 protein [Desulfovibrio sp. OttesenSCG-928-F20]